MKLRGIDFGNVLGASGVQGFFGEGYWPHKILKHVGLNFKGMTFVSKTSTLYGRPGNMPLTDDYRPREWFPPCLKIRFARGLVVNSVGLAGPSINALLATGKWQARKEPFFISVMSVAPTKQERFDEFWQMVEIFQWAKRDFSAPFGLQVNLSCPNIGHNPGELIRESSEVLSILGTLNIPLMPKYSIATAPIEAVMELDKNPHCDAICVSNTLPFGWKEIDWKKVWGSDVSPLTHLGGGGLSGAFLCPLVCYWIARLRALGFSKSINGGGGILCKTDMDSYYQAYASSVFLGSVAILRPWRVAGIIRHANTLDWRKS